MNKEDIIERVIYIINNKNLILKELSESNKNHKTSYSDFLIKLQDCCEREIELFIENASFSELVEISKANNIDNKYSYRITDILATYGISEDSIPFGVNDKFDCDFYYLLECIIELLLIVPVQLADIDNILKYYRKCKEGYKCIEMCERYDKLYEEMDIEIIKEAYTTIMEKYLIDLREMNEYNEELPLLSLKTLLKNNKEDKILCFFYLLAYDCFLNNQEISDVLYNPNTVKIIEKGYAYIMFTKLENLHYEYRNDLIYVTFDFPVNKSESICYSDYF